jgi:hypothetical protein
MVVIFGSMQQAELIRKESCMLLLSGPSWKIADGDDLGSMNLESFVVNFVPRSCNRELHTL